MAGNGADASGNGGDGGQAVGGILAAKSSQLTLTDATVSANTATSGVGGSSTIGTGGDGGNAFGGMFVIDDAPLTMRGSTFSHNTAQAGDGGPGISGGKGGSSYGGGLFSPDGTLQISSSTFDHNLAAAGAGGAGSLGAGGAGGEARGGGLAGGSRSGSNSIVNSTIYANEADGGTGGAGAASGAAGLSAGGGVSMDTALALTLISSTLDANIAGGAGPGYGGNLYDQPTALTLAQDIVADGVGNHGANCAIAAPETDAGHNLESTAPSQCGFAASEHDRLGVDPRLESLADNGGSSKTIALAAGSPAVGAGGTCLDYALAGDPQLTADQRGKTRPVPCDIGAFQTEPSWGGGGGGSRAGGGGGGSGGGGPTLTISRFRQSASRWRAGSAIGVLAALGQRPPIGTTFRFTLSAASTVSLEFTRRASGRRERGRCVATTRLNRHARRCMLKTRAGTLTCTDASAGAGAIHFEGRLSHGRRLKPGNYTVVLAAHSGGHRVHSAPLRFTIARG